MRFFINLPFLATAIATVAIAAPTQRATEVSATVSSDNSDSNSTIPDSASASASPPARTLPRDLPNNCIASCYAVHGPLIDNFQLRLNGDQCTQIDIPQKMAFQSSMEHMLKTWYSVVDRFGLGELHEYGKEWTMIWNFLSRERIEEWDPYGMDIDMAMMSWVRSIWGEHATYVGCGEVDECYWCADRGHNNG